MSDEDFQQALQERLNHYGNMLLDEEEHDRALKKAKRKHSSSTSTPSGGNMSILPSQTKTKRNSKLKKKTVGDTKKKSNKRNGRHLSVIKEHVKKFDLAVANKRLSESVRNNEGNNASPDGPKASCQVKKTVAPEVVVYENPSKKRKMQKMSTTEQQSEESGARFSMKLARHEVNRLGISGFVKTKREEVQAAIAMKLGAKPPKKEYVNYKVLQKMKKKEREDMEQTLDQARQNGLKTRKIKGREKTDKLKKELGFVDGQIGTYRNGVQVLSKSDVESIKMAKTAKTTPKFRKGR